MCQDHSSQIPEVTQFICKYAGHLMGCGVQTSRVVRNSQRIADSFGLAAAISTLGRTMTVTVKQKNLSRKDDPREAIFTRTFQIKPGPIRFAHNANLSALSWEIYDKHLTLNECWSRYYEETGKPLLSPLLITLLASLANLSFCRLFGGNALAMLIVFLSTAIAFRVRQVWGHHLTLYMQTITTAFFASMMCSVGLYVLPSSQAEIVLITSVLFLIPGVPLVNGVVDMMEGFTLVGLSRLIRATILILCIAVGLGGTLVIFHNSLL